MPYPRTARKVAIKENRASRRWRKSTANRSRIVGEMAGTGLRIIVSSSAMQSSPARWPAIWRLLVSGSG